MIQHKTSIALTLGGLVIGTVLYGALSTEPVVSVAIKANDMTSMPQVQQFIADAKSKTAFCVISEETPLAIKRALRGTCTMRILPKGSTIEQLQAEAISLRASKGEQRANQNVIIQ